VMLVGVHPNVQNFDAFYGWKLCFLLFFVFFFLLILVCKQSCVPLSPVMEPRGRRSTSVWKKKKLAACGKQLSSKSYMYQLFYTDQLYVSMHARWHGGYAWLMTASDERAHVLHERVLCARQQRPWLFIAILSFHHKS
jgi:hypothetical protein